MPIIKPISELRNYPDVLKNASAGTPVYLTKKGWLSHGDVVAHFRSRVAS